MQFIEGIIDGGGKTPEDGSVKEMFEKAASEHVMTAEALRA